MSVGENDNIVFIDIQGFRAHMPTFIVKEFCLIEGIDVFHHIVDSPFAFNRLPQTYKRQAHFLTKHHHGVRFDCGDITAKHLLALVFPRILNKTVLVKGLQKVEWLKTFFKKYGEITCYNIEDLISNWKVKRQEEYECCKYHSHIYGWNSGICALSIALKIKENWESHLVLNQSTVESDEIKTKT